MPDAYAVEVEAGRADPLPDYVEVVQISRSMGIPPWEVVQAPHHWIEKYRMVLAAESAARKAGERR